MRTYAAPREMACAVVCVLSLVGVGCRESGSRVEPVDPLSPPLAAASVQADPVDGAPAAGGDSAPTRRGGDGPESVLEFGLFGPVVPAAGTEVWESDCSFDDDPYETCL